MLKVEDQGSVRLLTLNRPERRNALGTAGMQRLAEAFQSAESQDAVKAIVLTGAPPAFCAGSDLKELGGLSIPDMRRHELETAEVTRKLAFLSKPVVSAVEGYALGGGFILAVSCDVVVTATNTRWHLPEVTNGWIPPWGLYALLARVGPVKARLLTWGAEPIDGQEAMRLGVADYSAEPGSALDRAVTIAQGLAKLPSEAVASTKRFYAPFAAGPAERLDFEASTLFAADCAASSARATLDRFTVKS
jgi:enoyl-CoA hydratase/carnithine racemase